MFDIDLVGVADRFAEKAHDGQKDKAGVDYICHPRAVAEKCDSSLEKCIALLHDVVEDCGVQLHEIRNMFGDEVADAVWLLTKPDDMDYMSYIRRLGKSGNISAIRVKIADLGHNSDLGRLKKIGPDDVARAAKYAAAKDYLESILNN